MLRTLLETRHRAPVNRGGAALSVMVHAGVIAATVVATATADATPRRPERPQTVIFAPPPADPARPLGAPSAPPAAPLTVVPREPPVVAVFVEVPDHLTDPGTTTVVDPFVPPSHPAPGPKVGGDPAGAGETGIWSEHMVEKPVMALGDGPRPRYPDLLRSAGVEGEVLAQFVVDTSGRVEPGSIRVLRTSHPLFAEAVERVLPLARFVPAEAGSRRVRQLVQQPFAFAMQR